ncbi:unnamed protein product [Rotaria magnacalcarata]|uniref:Uncharacterized protein n=1 Tax=Rotaria magnacalcarata TaxID=392030 RepID=A0A816AME5_9BILA|nr:unnamed protein product [Rotaria magnacalcarata]CAF1600061.1 unnamed protein product [Rotaria magnacalcarata]CAF2059500.1 unnamed protein product [Rotaria magnacalcarata]CAF2119390.1 unnamed protein product [Rotaria magnacalcarata]CAF3987938.1 unnamed protein product [Rotaria magnacalcarata]
MWVALDEYPSDNHARQLQARKKLSITSMLTEIKQQQIDSNENMNKLYELQVNMNKNINKVYEEQINMNKNQNKFFEQQIELI